MFKAKSGGSATEASPDILDELLQLTQPQNKHHMTSATRVFMAPKFKKPRAARGLTGVGQATLPSLGHANLVEKGHKVNCPLHKTMSNPTKKPSSQQRHLQPSLLVRRSRDLGPPLHSEPQLHPQVRTGLRASETLVEGGENSGGRNMGVIATRGMKRKAGADGPGGIPPLHAMAPGSKRKPLAAIDNLQSAAQGDGTPGGFLLQSASGRKVDVSAAAVAGVMKLFGEDGGEWQQGEQGMKGPQGQQGMEGQQGVQGQQEMQGAEGKQGSQGCMALGPVTNESTAVALTTALNPSPLSLPPEPPPQPPHTAAALIPTALNPSRLSMLPLQPPPRPPAGSASLFQTARGKPVPLSSAAVDKACALLGVQQRPRFDDSAHLGGGSTDGSTVGAGLFQTASNKPVRLSSAAVDKACALLGVQQYKGPQFVAPQITLPTHKPAALPEAQGHERQSSHAPAGMELSVRNPGAELAVVVQPDGGAGLRGAIQGGATVRAGLFQTARGKPVSVSSAAVDKACALLGVQQYKATQCVAPHITPPTHKPAALPDAQGHERQSSHLPSPMELAVRNSEAELAVMAQPDGGARLGGARRGRVTVRAGLFQTARGKPVSMSSAAVDKACALLGVQQGPPALPDAQGHERQSSHAPAGMELSVRNSGAELAVMAQPDGRARVGGADRGGATVKAGLFQTGRGKPVSVSSAAVDKACALLGVQQGPPALLDAQGHERQSSHAPAGMELSVRNSGAELAVVAQPDGGARLGGAGRQGATVAAGLFQTGRGKPVSVSSAAVDKARALLGVQQGPPALLDAQGHERQSSHAPATKELSVRNSGAELAVVAQPGGRALSGGASRGGATVRAGLFQTGRGKPVSVSSAAVDKACALLGVQQDKGPPQIVAPRISDEPTVPLLLESSGAERANAVQPDGGASPGAAAVGGDLFRTARGKPVHISSAAVDNACALLGVQQYKGPPQMEAPRMSDEPAVLLLEGAGAEQMRAVQPDSGASRGGATVRTTLFQTASEKPVSLSSAAVDKACALLGVQQHQRPRFEGSASPGGATVRTAGLFQTASKKPVHISSAAVDKACALFGVQHHERPQVEAEESALRPPSPPSWPLALSQPSSQGAAEPAVEARAALARAEEMVASLFDLGTGGSGRHGCGSGEGQQHQPHDPHKQPSPAPSPHTPSLAQPPPLRSSPHFHPTSPLRPCPPPHPSSPLHRSGNPSHPSNSPLHPSHTPLHSSPNRLHNASLHTFPTPLHRPGTTLRRPLTPLNRSPSTSPSPRRPFIPPTSTIPSLFSKHRPPRSRSAGLPPIPMRSLTDAADAPTLDVNQKAVEGRMTAYNGAVSMSTSGLRTDGAGAASSGAGGREVEGRREGGGGAAVMVGQQEGGLRRLHDLYRDAEGKPRRRPCMAEFFGYPPGLERVEGKVSEAVRKMTAESTLTFVGDKPLPLGGVEAGLSGAQLPSSPGRQDAHGGEGAGAAQVPAASFPRRLAGRMLTVERVLEQLKYRYEREVNEAKRSALKKVCERDAAAGSPMVLCISAVRSQQGASGRGVGGEEGAMEEDKSGGEEEEDGEGREKRQEAGGRRGVVAEGAQTAVIEVTDGWYWLPARLDGPLTDLLNRGRLFIGQKIRVCGAVLNGCMEGLPPLEACTAATLALHFNGTFPAHWSSKLGFCRQKPPVPMALRRVRDDGGPIPLTCVAIARDNPAVFWENNTPRVAAAAAPGDTMRSARAEAVEELASSRREQRAAMEKAQLQRVEKRRAAVQEAVDDALADEGLKERDVCPVVKVRVVGLTGKRSREEMEEDEEGWEGKGGVGDGEGEWSKRMRQGEGMISIWRPSEEQLQELVEGAVYLVAGLQPSATRRDAIGPLLSLNANRSTKWRRLGTSAVQRSLSFSFPPRQWTPLALLPTTPPGREVDVVALVLAVGQPRAVGAWQTGQWLLLLDGSGERERCENDGDVGSGLSGRGMGVRSGGMATAGGGVAGSGGGEQGAAMSNGGGEGWGGSNRRPADGWRPGGGGETSLIVPTAVRASAAVAAGVQARAGGGADVPLSGVPGGMGGQNGGAAVAGRGVGGAVVASREDGRATVVAVQVLAGERAFVPLDPSLTGSIVSVIAVGTL
ncbi:unnamed protein product [Closterium sp. Naga37s-1]|nr:unnamed protein product [Closterium sp. Naga37s-1]